jgi:4-hydroxy-tetrahydrodipicolinate reductase
LNERIEQDLRTAAQKAPILYTANMSIGVNLIVSLVEQAAQKLGTDWDIEIFETHHHMKIDSPSGTALALGKAAQAGRDGGDFVTDRTGKRKTGDIGYAVQRGGDVVGEHTVTFFGKGERIEIGHKATDRALFARGALKAAQWLGGQPPGLYSMKSVLGL